MYHIINIISGYNRELSQIRTEFLYNIHINYERITVINSNHYNHPEKMDKTNYIQ